MPPEFDLIIQNGTIYDGSGQPPVKANIAIKEDRIAKIGTIDPSLAKTVLDADGLAISPGFINVMSWAPITSLHDGRSQSDIRQGVTLEVFGEAWSEGPLNEEMRAFVLNDQADIKFDVTWSTLGEFLEHLVKKGVSNNVASYLGATTLRIYAMGFENRPPDENELSLMKKLTHEAMQEGALGLSTALIYPPGGYAKTEELIELAKVVAEYDGIYISHLRSEGDFFHEALDELLTIAREANIRAEIYHLKAMGQKNWPKMDQVFEKVEAAQAEGLNITADMYTYVAGGTGLTVNMPPWVEEGGHEAMIKRLKDPETRARIRQEMEDPNPVGWENMFQQVGNADNILLTSFKSEKLKALTGKTLAEAAKMRGIDPIETIFDLIVEDDTRVEAIYFSMTEENLEKQLQKPWVCIGSDAPSQSPEGAFLKSSVHPRAYGTFARYLGKYVREKGLIPLEEAIRKITSFPADNLKIKNRGLLKEGFYADIAVFDPQKIIDKATFEEPQQFAEGMQHVFVNGVQVLKDGEHTGAMPGQVVRGPGYKG
ncbi:MAG: D-aminoacylase [Anaerolineaceae bacterium]|nr:D-aminoacylase [Anaerolineaceae bacterium]